MAKTATVTKLATARTGKIEVTFDTMSEKKNSVRYDSDRDADVTSIYVSRAALAKAFGKTLPEGIKITIEAAE